MRSSSAIREVSIAIKVALVTAAEDAAGDFACLSCGGVLTRHQLALDRPDNLIGLCVACGEWHFTHLASDGLTLLIAHSPIFQLLPRLEERCGLAPQRDH